MFLKESAVTEAQTSNDVQITIAATPEALLETLLEAQSELYNLNMSMIRLEHNAIKNENGILLEKGIAEYWATFVKWVKGVWAKVVAWFKGIWEKVTNYFKSAGAFVQKYVELLKSSDLDVKGLTAGIYPNYNINMPIIALTNAEDAVLAIESTVSRDLTATLTADNLRDAVLKKLGGKLGQTVGEIVQVAIFGGEKEVKPVTNGYVKACVDFLEKLGGIANAISNSQKKVNEAFAESVKVAEGLVNSTEDANEKKKMMENTARNKSVIARFLSQFQSAVVSNVSTAAGHSISICKSALMQNAKNKKAVKKEDSVLSTFGLHV